MKKWDENAHSNTKSRATPASYGLYIFLIGLSCFVSYIIYLLLVYHIYASTSSEISIFSYHQLISKPKRSATVAVLREEVEPLTQSTRNTTTMAATLDTIPTELQLLIKSHLNPIDATCFALAAPSLYNNSIIVTPPLTSTVPTEATTSATVPVVRSSTPLGTPLNFRPRPTLSRTASAHATPQHSSGYSTPSDEKTQYFHLEIPSICHHCRSTRCSLHNHIAGFVGSDFEFCSVRGKFIRTDDDASSDDGSVSSGMSGHRSCWRSCPPRPGVCGRHGA